MTYFTRFYLDNEKDIVVTLYWELDDLYYCLSTPNHHTGNLIRNLARLIDEPLSEDENGLLVIKGKVPCYVDGNNEDVWVFRMGNMKVANIHADGRVELKARIPAISKTLMSQTKDYSTDLWRTIFKDYIPRDYKFRSDLHTHMNANLSGDILIALGIIHQIRYPLYYVRKLELALTPAQEALMAQRRARVEKQFVDSDLQGKYLARKINDNTFINFADLILHNLDNAEENIAKIRASLSILKDGQAVFTNLEKVYLYRYVFCKGREADDTFRLVNVGQIPDDDIRHYVYQMMKDREDKRYHKNSLFQDLLLWIARTYQSQGIVYAEISDTTLVKKYESIHMLEEVHEVMPEIYKETGVMLRFLAAIRRIPLTIVKDAVTPDDYLSQNIAALKGTALDPYVAGVDFVGEEINDIISLKPVFREIAKIAADDPDFVIRVHAGENDSQKENIAHSIECVRDSLASGQKMPRMRIGHGLYTYSLSSQKGRELMEAIRDSHIVLEFQITSNVRLNNLNSLENHPLKQYLEEGIMCVQGTDGAAIYGTSPRDEQLSLMYLLGLDPDQVASMKHTDQYIIDNSVEGFERKQKRFEKIKGDHSIEETILSHMGKSHIEGLYINKNRHLDAVTELKSQIDDLPWDRTPVILVGGSFNTEKRTTRTTDEGIAQLHSLMEKLDPSEYFFVIGHKLSGYEKQLVDFNRDMADPFDIYAFVPSLLTSKERNALKDSGVHIRISPDLEGMGIYKSVNYEIYERRPSILIAMDGNSAGENMIQEAKNGKGKARIYVWKGARHLLTKAESLEGYVRFFDSERPLESMI